MLKEEADGRASRGRLDWFSERPESCAGTIVSYVTLRGWFGSSALDRELDEELQFHFDRQVQANLDAGMTLEQARRSAALAIGNAEPIREASRDARAGALLRQIGRDLWYGMRLLTQGAGVLAAAIAIIALGVGAVTAIFSVVYGVRCSRCRFPSPIDW